MEIEKSLGLIPKFEEELTTLVCRVLEYWWVESKQKLKTRKERLQWEKNGFKDNLQKD